MIATFLITTSIRIPLDNFLRLPQQTDSALSYYRYIGDPSSNLDRGDQKYCEHDTQTQREDNSNKRFPSFNAYILASFVLKYTLVCPRGPQHKKIIHKRTLEFW